MRNLIVVAFLALAFTGFAQNDAKAGALLTEVSTKIKAYKNILLLEYNDKESCNWFRRPQFNKNVRNY